MKKVLAVVVTYNRLELLKKCLKNLTWQDCDILIIDNASTDATADWVQETYAQDKHVFYMNMGQNLGGAGGFNFGMRWAVEHQYEYAWVMDDDCIPEENALEMLMQADRILGGNYGYLSSVVLWEDGTESKMNRQKIKKNYYENVHLLKDGIVQVEQSTFVSLLIPTATIKNVGLPIKEFFIWGDDIEYTRRITVRNDLPSYMIGNSIVLHAMRENGGSNIATDTQQRIDRYKYAFRNENYLYRQEGIKGFCYYVAKCALNIWRVCTKAENHKLKRCSIILSSMVKGLFFNPEKEFVLRDN